jgi:hypothetical protein
MQRQPIRRGGIRSAGYDRARRELEIELDTGRVLTYVSVGEDLARRFMTSAAPASFYRDNIEDEFSVRGR